MTKMPAIVTAEEAIKTIPVGQRIFLGSGAGVPTPLVKALRDHGSRFQDNQVAHILTLGDASYATEELRPHLLSTNFFIGGNVRSAVQAGIADYVPMFLSEIPRFIKSGAFPIHSALVTVSEPDRHGMCSLGVSVDVVRAAVDTAKQIIAVVNPKMPRTFGQTFIPYSSLSYVVKDDSDIPELKPAEQDEEVATIGRYVATLIDDGCILQMGIGGIPDAVLSNIGHKRNLGIHTEMLSDGLIELMLTGVITNQTKKVMTGRVLTSFAMGTRRLYDYIHENALVEFYPSDFTNDPYIISKNERVVAINSALQVDLSGQVCADSIGHRFYSGIGGQVDFIRGAARSRFGKPIIALPSTAKNGTISRIVPELLGAGVVTSRGDVHYVVTEYGIASLYGKSVRERSLELISVAHPDFRSQLMQSVKETRYVVMEDNPLANFHNYPLQMDRKVQTKGGEYHLRALKPTDERLLQDFFYSHSQSTIQKRYRAGIAHMTHRRAQELLQMDYQNTMALALLDLHPYRETLAAVARYVATDNGHAELAVVTHENHRRKGLAKLLLQELIQYGQDLGIKQFHCMIEGEDQAVMRLFSGLSTNMITNVIPREDGWEVIIDPRGEKHDRSKRQAEKSAD